MEGLLATPLLSSSNMESLAATLSGREEGKEEEEEGERVWVWVWGEVSWREGEGGKAPSLLETEVLEVGLWGWREVGGEAMGER